LLTGQGDALVQLADVLSNAGQTEAAADSLARALDRYERKRNVVMVARVRERLATSRRR
jgi:thioredoxin-like negative regulator of GroEL